MANISVIAAILPCALAGKFRSNVVLGDCLQVALMSNSRDDQAIDRLSILL